MLLVLVILGIKGIKSPTISIVDILRFKFGTFDPRALVFNDYTYSIATLALVANSPQVILSVLYFSYNSLLTTYLTGYEWVSYAHKRKGLRVSAKPKGAQRSTYFLQLPYRFVVPLAVVSAVLHWLVSQSIFVVAFDTNGIPEQEQTRTCGWSPIAVVIGMSLLGILMITIQCMGGLLYKRGMPIADCSSSVISAACHPKNPRPEDGPVSEQKLQWGVVETGADGISHCAFSSRHVRLPVEGGLYI